jgi:hypothetical protein
MRPSTLLKSFNLSCGIVPPSLSVLFRVSRGVGLEGLNAIGIVLAYIVVMFCIYLIFLVVWSSV